MCFSCAPTAQNPNDDGGATNDNEEIVYHIHTSNPSYGDHDYKKNIKKGSALSEAFITSDSIGIGPVYNDFVSLPVSYEHNDHKLKASEINFYNENIKEIDAYFVEDKNINLFNYFSGDYFSLDGEKVFSFGETIEFTILNHKFELTSLKFDSGYMFDCTMTVDGEKYEIERHTSSTFIIGAQAFLDAEGKIKANSNILHYTLYLGCVFDYFENNDIDFSYRDYVFIGRNNYSIEYDL